MEISYYVELISALCGAFAYLIVASRINQSEISPLSGLLIVILSALVTVFGVQILIYFILYNPMEVVDFLAQEIREGVMSEFRSVVYLWIGIKLFGRNEGNSSPL